MGFVLVLLTFEIVINKVVGCLSETIIDGATGSVFG